MDPFKVFVVLFPPSMNFFSMQIKRMFAQVIIAMADHGYLELEGGHNMVEFIVRQCSLEDEPKVRLILATFSMKHYSFEFSSI